MKNFLSKLISKYKVWRCRANKHCGGFWHIVEQTPTGDWEPPRGLNKNWIRPICNKIFCSECCSIFLEEKAWDYYVGDFPTR